MNQIVLPPGGAPDKRPSAVSPSVAIKEYLGPHLARRRMGLSSLSGRYACLMNGDDCEDGELVAFADQQEGILRGRASRGEIGRLVAAMLDAFSTYDVQRAPGYADFMLAAIALEAEVAPFSAEALAGAAYTVARAERFAPPADVVIAAIRTEQREARLAARLAREELARRRAAAA